VLVASLRRGHRDASAHRHIDDERPERRRLGAGQPRAGASSAWQNDAAIDDYDEALRRRPKTDWSLYGRGLAKQRKGQRAEGDADIAAALALNPGMSAEFKRYGIIP
jgi:hypothetical protein